MSLDQQKDAFYIGYLPTAPTALAPFLRGVAATLLAFAVTLALLLVTGMSGFAPSRFEFGSPRVLEGTLVAFPSPMLLVDRPGETDDAAAVSPYLLVGEGKFGVEPALSALDGRRVRVQGTLIYEGSQTLVEVVGGSAVDLGPGQPAPATVSLGQVQVVGEIVDSKCFFGVMNPGNLKPHRACAARCLSGGVPPTLLVRQPDGTARYLLLVGPQGESIGAGIGDRVAEPVSVTGALERQGDRLILKAALADIRRME